MSSPRPGKAIFAAAILLLAACAPARSDNAAGQNDVCASIPDQAARARCLEQSGFAGEGKQAPVIAGGWRLLTTANTAGGADEVSLAHTPEASRSDPNLAGLMLHCRSGHVEVLLVVLEPYPPQATVEATVRLGKKSPAKYRADVAPSGLVLRLPDEAATPILSSTDEAAELLVQLAGGTTPITNGLIKLAGLAQALKTLKGLCARP